MIAMTTTNHDINHAITLAETLIIQFEGLSLKPYTCPAGIKTIGYGHTIRHEEQMHSITEIQARQLLQHDIKQTMAVIARSIKVPLDANQLASLISFTFNIGGAALQCSTLRQKINRGEHQEVPGELMRWVWAGGKILHGLVKRRNAEGNVYIL
jgi:lysozyme